MAAFSQKIKATGTGQTTGHIANLLITHDGTGTIHLAAQTVYIPSAGKYQPYIALIPETQLPAGTTTIPIQGYCTDIHLQPLPEGNAMPAVETWVAVGSQASLPANYVYAAPGKPVSRFTQADIPAITSSPHYLARPVDPRAVVITWPGTKGQVGGMFGANMPDAYNAKILVTAYENIEHAYESIRSENTHSTPFSYYQEKERKSVIQQALWVYAAALKGTYYTENDFVANVHEQFEDLAGTAINAMPAAQKAELDRGIRQFWELFMATGVKANLISYPITVSTTSMEGTATVPWSEISLIGAHMKPGHERKMASQSNFPLVPVLFGVGGAGVAAVAILAGGGDDEDCGFTIALQPTDATCGEFNGRISSSVTPAGTYTYMWSNGTMSNNLNNVPAGMYSVTVTRTGTSCTEVASATVGSTAANFNASITTQNSDCGHQNGRAMVAVQPPGTYTYVWSNGSTQQNQTNLAAGNYTLTVSTGGSCQKTYNVQIGQNTFSPQINMATTPASCGLADGTITATVTPPDNYTYAWSNGQGGPQATGLNAGSYTLTVTLAGSNCTKSQSVVVEEGPAGFTVSVSSTPAGCGLSDGSVTATVNPPGTYNYTWSNGQGGSQINGLAPGSYTVTVSVPGASCTQQATTTVNELQASFTVNVSSTPATCGVADGTATATVNPPGNYEYIWSNGQTGSQINGLGSGSYTVTVSVTGSACSREASITVNELPAGFTVSIASTPAGCGLTDGTATATVNPPGNYEYTWSNGQTGSQISGLDDGTYSVTVNVPGSNCIQEASTTVSELPSGFTVSVTTTTASCGVADGSATANVNPPGNYEYAWSNGQTGSQITGVGVGVYTVTVTIAGTSCAEQATATVSELPPGYTISASSTPAGCGLSNGTASVVVDPPGTYTYAWSNGQSGATITGLMAGNYTVAVSIPGSNCSQAISVEVDELPPTFTLSFTSTPAGCGLSNGNATVTANPPGTYTYAWSNGSSGMQLSNVPAGDYTVTVTISGTMCAATGAVHVDQVGGGYTASFVTDNAACGLSNGSATVSVSPPGEYTFQWSTGQSGPVLEPVASGTYSVTVMNEEGCTESFNVFVGQDPAEYINILNSIPGNCTGNGNITFSATTPGAGPLNITINGPAGINTISVASGVYNLSAFMSVLPGAYTFTVIDQSIGPACSETANATVIDNTPELEALYDDYDTEGTVPVEGNVLFNDEGLNIQMTQVDNEIGGTVTFSANGDFVFIADLGFFGEASFVYTVTDACGTTATAIVTIIVEEVPCDIQVVFDHTEPTCGFEDGEITISVIEPGEYEFEWSNGESGETIQDVPAGSYFVTITNVNTGCTLEESTLLEGIPSDYIDDIEVIHPTCEAGGDIEFIATSPVGNQLIMTVDHPNGSGDFEIDPGLVRVSDYVTTGPGEYFIEVADPESGPGCTESFSVTLNTPPNLQIVVVEAIPPSEPDEDDGSAFVEVTIPGQFPYAVYVNGMFAFTVSQNNFFIINLSAGTYTVYVVDINACQSNTEEFEVLPEGVMEFGSGIVQSGLLHEQNERPGVYEDLGLWRSTVTGSYRHYIGNMEEELRLSYAIPEKHTPFGYLPGILNLEFLTRVATLKWNGVRLKLQGGIGGQHMSKEFTEELSLPTSAYWLGRMSAGYRLGKKIHVNGNVTIRGWDRVEPLRMEFTVKVPFYTYMFRN